MIDAVVFDLDGVLVDSEPVWEEVRRDYVAELRGRWTAADQHRLMGMSTREWSRYLSVDLGLGRPADRVAAEVIDRMAERYARGVPLLPDAVSAVRRMAARWPLGLASSSPPVLIARALESAGLTSQFAATLSTEEVPRGKPAPDAYLAIAERLGVPPAHCVAIEDSSNGIRAAAAAGLRVVAVPQPSYPPAPDALDRAAAVLPDLAALTVQQVEALD